MNTAEAIGMAIEALKAFRQDAADKAHVDRAIGALMQQLSVPAKAMRLMYLEDIAHKREFYKMDLWTFGS